MKKSLFVLGVAVAALASCTNEEVVNIAESNVIKFDNAFVGNTTKVAVPELDEDNIEDIYVYAVKGSSATNVFDQQPKNVYKTTAGEWAYDNPVKWEQDSYKFVAYAGTKFTSEVSATQSSGTDNYLTFTNVTVDNDHQFDLLYTTTGVTADYTNGLTGVSNVKFSFDHILSMIQITLKSGFGETTKVAISNIKFYGMQPQGTYNTSNDGLWTASGTALNDATALTGTDGEATGASISGGGAATDVVNSWVVIPQTISNQPEMVKFSVTVTDGSISEQKDFTAKLPANTSWEKGNRYNYIFTITPKAMEIEDEWITFDAPTVNPWTDAADGELTE